jgi:hypothetical protein
VANIEDFNNSANFRFGVGSITRQGYDLTSYFDPRGRQVMLKINGAEAVQGQPYV